MKNHHYRRIQVLVGLVAFATLGLAQLLSVYAGGVLFVAPTGNDANTCLTMSSACKTIASAVSKASAGDTIIIAAGTYTEGIGIDKDLTLIGFGADATLINQGRIVVSNATVRIYDLAIMHGYNIDNGGALYNDRGKVTLGHASILSSHANYDGGGIYNYQGTLSLDNTIVGGNSAVHYGGGIYNNNGNVSLSHTIVQSNSACNTACIYIPSRNLPGEKPDNGFLSFGGGINNDAGIMTIETSAIISNSSASGGDGVYNYGLLVITNSTISNNAGVAFGLQNESVVTLTNVTLSGNVTNLRSLSPARTFMQNTIFANSSSGNNCFGSNFTSLGHNLSSDNSCTLNASGDMTNTNPLLGPLQNNGGPTLTDALLSGSPAINAGTNAICPATDQRGVVRPQAGICDIGAYESVFSYETFLPVVAR